MHVKAGILIELLTEFFNRLHDSAWVIERGAFLGYIVFLSPA
jgi:hypothetical protein